MQGVFNDEAFYAYTGLRVRSYAKMGHRSASFDGPFPRRTVAAHLYINFPTYLTIPKPARFKTFWMMRDPRDVLVSFYFAARYSHVPVDVIPELRGELEAMDEQTGLHFILDRLDDYGLFETMRSWMNPAVEEAGIRVVRYEDLAADSRTFLAELFRELQVEMPDDVFDSFCERRSFTSRSGGRSQGEEDVMSHYRKGVSGDWKLHFDGDLTDHFRRVTGDLIEVLSYPEEGT
jgi:hypothetical protein